MHRFLNPHQREVVHMLQYVAQASHELIPPETLEPAVKAIVNNWIKFKSELFDTIRNCLQSRRMA